MTGKWILRFQTALSDGRPRPVLVSWPLRCRWHKHNMTRVTDLEIQTEHSCWSCSMKMSNPNARQTCYGVHSIPCYRYHQTMHAIGTSHKCATCVSTDEYHHKRHRTVRNFPLLRCLCVAADQTDYWIPDHRAGGCLPTGQWRRSYRTCGCDRTPETRKRSRTGPLSTV